MQDVPRRTLIELIQKYGGALSEDPRRVEALLRDYVGTYRREIAVLVGAAREGIPRELLDRQVSLPLELRKARLAQRLEENLALTPQAAHWAVETWAEALGIRPVPGSGGTVAPSPVTTTPES